MLLTVWTYAHKCASTVHIIVLLNKNKVCKIKNYFKVIFFVCIFCRKSLLYHNITVLKPISMYFNDKKNKIWTSCFLFYCARSLFYSYLICTAFEKIEDHWCKQSITTTHSRALLICTTLWPLHLFPSPLHLLKMVCWQVSQNKLTFTLGWAVENLWCVWCYSENYSFFENYWSKIKNSKHLSQT